MNNQISNDYSFPEILKLLQKHPIEKQKQIMKFLMGFQNLNYYQQFKISQAITQIKNKISIYNQFLYQFITKNKLFNNHHFNPNEQQKETILKDIKFQNFIKGEQVEKKNEYLLLQQGKVLQFKQDDNNLEQFVINEYELFKRCKNKDLDEIFSRIDNQVIKEFQKEGYFKQSKENLIKTILMKKKNSNFRLVQILQNNDYIANTQDIFITYENAIIFKILNENLSRFLKNQYCEVKEKSNQFLSSIKIMRNFDQDFIKTLLDYSKVIPIEVNQMVQNENKIARFFYIIIKGEIQQQKKGKLGKRFQEKQLFGEESQTDFPSKFSYKCIRQGQLIQFDTKKVMSCNKLLPLFKKRLFFILNNGLQDKIKQEVKTQRNPIIKETFIKKKFQNQEIEKSESSNLINQTQLTTKIKFQKSIRNTLSLKTLENNNSVNLKPILKNLKLKSQDNSFKLQNYLANKYQNQKLNYKLRNNGYNYNQDSSQILEKINYRLKDVQAERIKIKDLILTQQSIQNQLKKNTISRYYQSFDNNLINQTNSSRQILININDSYVNTSRKYSFTNKNDSQLKFKKLDILTKTKEDKCRDVRMKMQQQQQKCYNHYNKELQKNQEARKLADEIYQDNSDFWLEQKENRILEGDYYLMPKKQL